MDDLNPAGSAGAPPAAAPPAAPLAAPPADWHQTFDADTQAYITSKGLDKLPWNEAFAHVAQSHRQAETYIGIPADQRIRAPDARDPASVKAFWSKFGVPETADKYDLSGIKFSDNSELNPNFVSFVQQTALRHNIPIEAAQGLAKEFTGFLEKQDATELEQTTVQLQASRDNLIKLWGPNYQANLALADMAAKRLGVDVDTAALLGEKVGADKVLEMFRKIGAASSEDTFVGGNPHQADTPPMTVVEGRERLQQLQADKEFGTKLLNGDYEAKKIWDAAFAAAHPDVVAAAAA